MICLATTRSYAENGAFSRYDVTDLQRSVVTRSLVTTIADESERGLLLAEVERADARSAIRSRHCQPMDRTEHWAVAVLDVLTNESPSASGSFTGPPEHVQALLDRLSPLGCSAGVMLRSSSSCRRATSTSRRQRRRRSRPRCRTAG